MYSLYLDVYPPAPQPATTMQLVSAVLANSTEASLKTNPFYIYVEGNFALENKLSSLSQEIDEKFGIPLFDQQFLILENIQNLPPATITDLQKSLGIRAFVFPVAGRNMVILPPEARDSLYAAAGRELNRATPSPERVLEELFKKQAASR
jgi:hypothetical protein